MRTSGWLLVVVAVTVLDVVQSGIVVAFGGSLASAPEALLGVALLTVFVAVLTPVFFVALYFDAGVVRESGSPWTPSRLRWVGGGVIVLVGTYLLTSMFSLAFIGVPYLVQRYRARTPVVRDEVRVSDDSHERSVLSVLVHPLALFTGIVGAGLLYTGSTDAFTRENARHALNWHSSLAVLFVSGYSLSFVAADERSVLGHALPGTVLPAPFDTVVALLGLAVLLVAVLAWVATIGLALVATAKAVRGTAWRYPFSWTFVE